LANVSSPVKEKSSPIRQLAPWFSARHNTGVYGPSTRCLGDTGMPVKPIPDGYHTATPYLIIRGAAAALDFYKKAFGATELMRFGGIRGSCSATKCPK
jgi:hypothetical protein